jgi:predicted ATPase
LFIFAVNYDFLRTVVCGVGCFTKVKSIMFIKKLTFEDNARGWKLEQVSFNRLNLLVGASGVGKTQILNAIYALKQITHGASQNGVKWNVEFEIQGDKYRWQGEFETKKNGHFLGYNNADTAKRYKLSTEKIIKNDATIVEKKEEHFYLNGIETIKLQHECSLVFLMRAEDLLKTMSDAWDLLYFQEKSQTKQVGFLDNISYNEFIAAENVENTEYESTNFNIQFRLFGAFSHNKKIFNTIKQRFTDVFPWVEDIQFAPLIKNKEVEPLLQIKENGVAEWINETQISAGMLKVLFKIAALYLAPEGSVFLIDEFENSLGPNCIDELTDDKVFNLLLQVIILM